MQTILKIPGFMDNVFTHLLAGLGAGLFAVFIGSPVDVVCAPFTPSPLSHFFVLPAVFTCALDEHSIYSNDSLVNEMRQKYEERNSKWYIFNLLVQRFGA